MNAAGAPAASWDDACTREAWRVVQASLAEDLGERGDLTSSLVLAQRGSERLRGAVVAREAGVVAGCRVAAIACEAVGAEWRPLVQDGAALQAGAAIGIIEGPTLAVLGVERTLLNLLGLLCGTATITARYVAAVAGTHARVCDTRKTVPGLRRLQKHAVACGGGTQHRMGLHDAVLIKDNHLAGLDPRACAALVESIAPRARAQGASFVEVEVDGLDQLEALLALPTGTVDIILLDNFPLERLRTAVACRNARGPLPLLEASGGITLDTVAQVAATGVERISVGALTHSVRALDLGLDALA